MRNDDTPERTTDIRGQAGTGTVTIDQYAWTNDHPRPVLRSDGTMVVRQNGHDTPIAHGLTDDALAAIRAIVREEVARALSPETSHGDQAGAGGDKEAVASARADLRRIQDEIDGRRRRGGPWHEIADRTKARDVLLRWIEGQTHDDPS